MDFLKATLAKTVPALVAIAVFFIAAAVYFAPQFRGEVLPQHDVIQYRGMSSDIYESREQSGEDPQWTGRMFGGMPAYLINVAYPAQLVKRTVGQIVKAIDTPAGFLFFAMTAMWCMLLIMGVNPWVGIVPALAYGLSTYFLLIIGAGHITKMWALVYAPLMMGGAWITLRGNVWYGAAFTALATSLEIGANHPQITYYFLLAMAAFLQGAAWFVAHNASFDRRVLTGCCRAAGIAEPRLPFYCTLKGSRRSLPLPSHRLSSVCEHFQIPLQHHHAGSDAEACAEIYLRLRALGVSQAQMKA